MEGSRGLEGEEEGKIHNVHRVSLSPPTSLCTGEARRRGATPVRPLGDGHPQ